MVDERMKEGMKAGEGRSLRCVGGRRLCKLG